MKGRTKLGMGLMKIRQTVRIRIFAAALLAGLGNGMSRGGTDVWNGGSDSSWDTAANWSLSAAPEPADDASFTSPPGVGGLGVSLGVGETANSLTLDDGYSLNGGSLTLTSGAIGVAAGGTAAVNSVLAGTAGLTVNASGTLVLGGQNVFSGAIAIPQGTLSVASDAAFGASSNAISLGHGGSSGAVQATAAFATSHNITFNDPQALLVTSGNLLTLNGVLSGDSGSTGSALAVSGGGELRLTNSNTFSGSVNLSNAILSFAGPDGSVTADLDGINLHVYSGGTLELNDSSALGGILLAARGDSKTGSISTAAAP
jgi:fibronectin-binding autotransporter adhesin